MKFSQIKKLCKDADACMIYKDGPLTWLGTRDAAYPVADVDVNTASVKTLLDWPDVESDIGVSHMLLEASGLMPDEVIRTDVAFNRWAKLEQGMTVSVGGERVCPLVYSGGAMFVEWEKIKPAIRKGEYLDFRLAYNRAGHPLVLVTNGMMVTGIMRPMSTREAELIIETMGKLAGMRPEGTPGDAKKAEQTQEKEISGQISIEEAMQEADGEE